MSRTTAEDLIRLANDIGLNDKLYVTLKNKIPPNAKNVILNLSSDAHNGTHWTALRQTPISFIYFDSFGVTPPESVIQLAKKKGKKLYYNLDEYQHINEGFCGEYSLLFLWSLENNIDINTIFKVIRMNPIL